MVKRTSIKNSIRSLNRLIAKLEEGSEKRVKLEKSLAELEKKRLDVVRIEREKKNAKRYRGIRFVEWRKLDRKHKQLRRALAEAKDNGRDTEAIEGDINRVSRDLLYIKNYPNSEKYVSILLPPTEENAARIERIRAGIERRLKDEAIVAEADEGAAIRVVQGGDGAAAEDAEDDGIEAEDDFFLGEGEDGDLPVASTSAAPGGALPEVSGGESESESDSGAGEEGAGAGGRGRGPRAGAGRLGARPRTRPVIQDRKRGRVEGKPPRTPGGQQRGGSGGTAGTAGKPESKESTPARTRAEGGRKRRRKKN